MGFVKCPRCELNYMDSTQKVCDVCRREMRGLHDDGPELCAHCGERPAVESSDLCLVCLKEHMHDSTGRVDGGLLEGGLLDDMDDAMGLGVSDIDPMDLDIDSDIPGDEREIIDQELDDDSEFGDDMDGSDDPFDAE